MNSTMFAIVVLFPPAMFGVARLIEDWHTARRLREARHRHPTSRYDGDCGQPDCGLCKQVYRNG